MIKYIFSVLIFLTMLGACNRTSKEATKTKKQAELKKEVSTPKKVEKATVNEDFNSFYNKFHRDSVFQIKRIKFPLEGYAIDTSEQTTVWNKNNWITHRNTIDAVDTAVFKVETIKQVGTYYEKIFIEGGGFASERLFKRINGKWYLVKYIDEDL